MFDEKGQPNNQGFYEGQGSSRYQPPVGYNNDGNWQPPTPAPSAYSWPTVDGNNVSYNQNQPPIYPTPTYDPQAELYQRAARQANAKIRFYTHLKRYIMVNVLLWGIAFITGFGSLGHHWSFWSLTWPIWVTIFWGIGLVSEYVSVFVMNEHRKQNMIEEEMRRLRR